MVMSNTATSVIVTVTNVLTASKPTLLPPQISGSNVILTWSSVSNDIYRLQYNPTLALSNWTAIPPDITAISNITSATDTLTPSNRYYRVLAFPP